MGSDGRTPSPLDRWTGVLERLRRLISGARDTDQSQPEQVDLDAARLRAQVKVIRQAFRETGLGAANHGGGPVEDDSDIAYLFRPRHALVRQQDVTRVREFFLEWPDRYDVGPESNAAIREPDRTSERLPELVLMELPTRRDGGDDVLDTLDELDEELEEGLARPDHVVYVTAKGAMCPATEPEETRATTPFPPLNDEKGGSDVRVSVVDTGWWKPAATLAATPWLVGVDADPEDEEQINQAAIHPYGGHGTFVTGVIRCMAPATLIDVEGALTHGGAVYESEICRQLNDAITEGRPHLISISAGTHTRKSLPMLAFETLAAKHGLDDGGRERPLIVAAAGNDSSKDKFWPAAFEWVVGVGSVDPDGKVSDFSNYGEWVEVWARGRDLVNAFPEGTYTCYEPDNIHNGVPEVRSFDGLAQWSGTSFSTPIVTGLIAAHMSATGNYDDPRRAYEELVSGASPCADPKAGGAPLLGPLS